MKKLIFAALGIAAWRWLAAPAEQGSGLNTSRRTDRDPVPGPNAAQDITYRIVEHDGGWAYKVGDVFSETFPSHDAALEAARLASRAQELAGDPEPIEYQDADGRWHIEDAAGSDRPHTDVDDTQPEKG